MEMKELIGNVLDRQIDSIPGLIEDKNGLDKIHDIVSEIQVTLRYIDRDVESICTTKKDAKIMKNKIRVLNDSISDFVNNFNMYKLTANKYRASELWRHLSSFADYMIGRPERLTNFTKPNPLSFTDSMALYEIFRNRINDVNDGLSMLIAFNQLSIKMGDEHMVDPFLSNSFRQIDAAKKMIEVIRDRCKFDDYPDTLTLSIEIDSLENVLGLIYSALDKRKISSINDGVFDELNVVNSLEFNISMMYHMNRTFDDFKSVVMPNDYDPIACFKGNK